MTIDSWIATAAQNTPDKAALIFESNRICYQAFDDAITDCAERLSKAGLGKGDRLVWYGLNHPDVFVLLFACAKIGASLVPVNWRLSVREIADIIADCAPSLIIHDAHFATQAKMLTNAPIVTMTDSWPESADSATSQKDKMPATADDALLIVYTSGSTGRPKGVVLTQKAIIANAKMSVHAHDMKADDSVLNVLPLFHVGGLNILPTPAFSLGASVHLHAQFDPVAAIAALQDVQLMIVVPTLLQAMMSHADWPSADLRSVRALSIGSTDVPRDLIDAIHARGIPMIQIYGATETAPFAIYQTIDEAFATAGSIGRAGIACQIALRDADGHDVPVGMAGEICVKGDNILAAYWNAPTQEDALRQGWFHTGDVAKLDEDGLYYFVDRIKHVIISGGENIYPAEIERVLRSHKDVAEICVLGLDDKRWGQVPVAVIVKAQQSLTADDITAFMQDKLARYKQPRRIIFIDEMPRNAMNKIVVSDVRDLVLSCA